MLYYHPPLSKSTVNYEIIVKNSQEVCRIHVKIAGDSENQEELFQRIYFKESCRISMVLRVIWAVSPQMYFPSYSQLMIRWFILRQL